MMNQVYTKLPDDRPITSLCVVEDVERCPEEYTVVSKTFDQDSDADLWKESGFFGKKCSRYLCLSKTKGIQDFAVQSLCIIHEKETPPENFKTIPKTIDSEQKAWRKKQICFKYAQISTSPTIITDIIILGRRKKVPTGFLLSGEINGLKICYKIGKNQNESNSVLYPQVPSSIHFNEGGNSLYNFSQHSYQNTPGALGNTSGDLIGEANNSSQPRPLPFRPAPLPPKSLYSTIGGYNGLEGVPFVLNPKYSFSANNCKNIPTSKVKTKCQIDEEYHYEFKTELEA